MRFLPRALSILPLLLAAQCLAAQPKAKVNPAPAKSAAAVTAPVVAAAPAETLTYVRLPEITDALLQRKLDSISKAAVAKSMEWDSVPATKKAKAGDPAADFAKAVGRGEYVKRVGYDKGNFDHWRVDSLLQKAAREKVDGEWRTSILPHGHAFRDALMKFQKNDTLRSTTFTYADSGRYQKTGEYAFQARYRFESDTTFRSREVFLDRGVVRWDYCSFRMKGDTLFYRLHKLEFRDLNDNWLDASQEFANIPPEVFFRKQQKR